MQQEEISQETLTKVVSQVSRLLQYNNSNASEGEVQNAAALAQSLMTKYNISMAQVEQHAGKITDPIERFRDSFRHYSHSDTPLSWRRDLLDTLARFNFCKFVFTLSRGFTDHFSLIGKKHNKDMVIYLYQYLVNEIVRLGAIGYKEYKKEFHHKYIGEARWKHSFYLGAVRNIHSRLEDQYTTDTSGTDTMALVVTMDKELEDTFKALVPKVKNMSTLNGHTKIHNGAYVAGKEAAENLSLDRPLDAGVSNKQIG